MEVRRLTLVLAAAALVAWGIGLGAETQEEQFLHKDLDEAKQYLATTNASGNLVLLTGLMVAAGVSLAVLALAAPEQWNRSLDPWRWLGALFVGTWSLVVLTQSSFPHVLGLLDTRQAMISIAPSAVHAEALASVLLPVFTLLLVALAVALHAVRRLLHGPPPGDQTQQDWTTLRRRHLAATAVALPFLGVAAGGFLRLMFVLPADQSDLALQYILSPVAALAALGIGVVAVVRTWNLDLATRRPHLAPVVREQWLILDRIDLFLYGGLAFVVLASTALPAQQVSGLAAGSVFGLSLRSHGQALVFLAVPLWALWRVQQPLRIRLSTGPHATMTPGHAAGEGRYGHAVAAVAVLAVALAAATGTAAFWSDTLVPWLAGSLPCAALVFWQGHPRHALVGSWTAALSLWGIGNTAVAAFSETSSPPLILASDPGPLALARFAGTLLLGSAVGRMALHVGRHERPPVAIPLAAVIGAAATLVPLLEASFSIWVITSQVGDAVALGNLIAAQSTPVKVIMHLLAAALVLGAAAAVARLVRPDWFRHRPVATATETGTTAPT